MRSSTLDPSSLSAPSPHQAGQPQRDDGKSDENAAPHHVGDHERQHAVAGNPLAREGGIGAASGAEEVTQLAARMPVQQIEVVGSHRPPAYRARIDLALRAKTIDGPVCSWAPNFGN